jgi:hypothetical protein
MDVRSLVLGMALLFIVFLGALTVKVLLTSGIDILVAISVLVLALFGVGIVSALLHPPEE